MECNRLEIGITPVNSPCKSCSSFGSFTPPVTIYVMPHRGNTSLVVSNTTDYDEEIQRVMDESFEEERDPEPKPASERTMEKMRQTVLQIDDLACGICLDTMIQGETIIETRCCHHFCHVECMERTLLTIPSCPFCRWSAD